MFQRSSTHVCGDSCVGARFGEVRYSVLQCVAVRCSVLQCVAVCCSVLQWWRVVRWLWRSVLQCVEVCCSLLQCVAQVRVLVLALAK